MTSRFSSSSITLELPYEPPLDWAHMLRFFAGRASTGVETVEGEHYRRAIEWDGASGTLDVVRHARKHCLVARIEGEVCQYAEALIAPLKRLFDLDASPAAIARCLSADPWLASLIATSPGLRVPGAWSGFELVVRTIVGQQVSVKGASTITNRIVERAGKRVQSHAHDGTAWQFPTPSELAAADLTGVGMPTKRIAAVQNFARAVADGRVPIDVPNADLGTVRESMLALPGIGPWTVEYVAMRALRDPDAWPGSDLVLMQAIARRDPALTGLRQQNSRSENWRPYRAYAAMHVWNGVALEAGVARGG
ncbi:DNA-3-methyladenine glycosylase II [Pararobbsia alpina]|uniref:DNA-3-methyladenine glycosylase family protein n=1 Tax=Pararobbsia alpina TaxID=621374 RepID=UPI0039A72F9D